MALENFLDNLRLAYRELPPPTVKSELGKRAEDHFASVLHGADLWLTPKSVDGFNPADFPTWPQHELDDLKKEVAAFSAIADKVPRNKPATKTQSTQARKHLGRVLEIVGTHLVLEWIEAQAKLMAEVKAAAQANGWHTQQDMKEVRESLLGKYDAPRLLITTQNRQEVVLEPVARFGSGGQGVIDLALMPTYQTMYLLTFKSGQWYIVPTHGKSQARPFSQATLVNAITKLPRS